MLMQPVLTSGDRLGAYEITGLLGTGGMGEVYKARDTRLNRSVAIKVIKANSGAPEQWRQRFEHEARAISTLSHPRICSLFDIGREGEMDFLVLEYLEGETLQERLRKRRLPVGQALSIAVQIAEGLEHAHRRGVLHRDLKPANVMLTKADVKLMDFGLAKIVSAASTSNLAGSLQATLTTEGTVAGTLQYMAPEQLEGKEPSEAGDIFSFGAVLFEMIAGRRAFEGNSPASVIAAVMRGTPPPVEDLQPGIPRALDRLIRQCLEKNPEERRESIHDVKAELQGILEDIGGTGTGMGLATDKTKVRVPKWIWIAGACLPLLAAVAVLRLRPTPTAAAKPVHFLIQPPENAAFARDEAPAVSPDGERVAFVGIDANGKRQLWVRPLDAARAQPVPGTDDASQPFWSPDGKWIGFFAGRKLKNVGVDGNSPHTLADVADPYGGAWGKTFVLFASRFRGSLVKTVPVNGGDVKLIDNEPILDHGDVAMHWPFLLPGERRYIFRLTTTDRNKRGVYIVSLDGHGKREMLVDSETNAEFARLGETAGGFLVYEKDSRLLARGFDSSKGQFTGDPTVVAEPVAFSALFRRGLFSAANDRVLAYRTGGVLAEARLFWWDRSGRELAPLTGEGEYGNPRISRDGSRVATTRTDPKTGGFDVWTIDTSRGVPTRLTFEGSDSIFPQFSPDGSRVVFGSNRDLYVASTGGNGADKLLYQSNKRKFPSDWSPDGRFILYFGPGGIWALPANGGEPRLIVSSKYYLSAAQISPDGKFLAYDSNESGRREVYVRPFDPEKEDAGPKSQISLDGGYQPAWDPAGREMYFITGDGTLVTVPIDNGFPSRSVPKPLFKLPLTPELGLAQTGGNAYAVQNANRFLVQKPEDNRDTAPLHVIVNWTAGLHR